MNRRRRCRPGSGCRAEPGHRLAQAAAAGPWALGRRAPSCPGRPHRGVWPDLAAQQL